MQTRHALMARSARYDSASGFSTNGGVITLWLVVLCATAGAAWMVVSGDKGAGGVPALAMSASALSEQRSAGGSTAAGQSGPHAHQTARDGSGAAAKDFDAPARKASRILQGDSSVRESDSGAAGSQSTGSVASSRNTAPISGSTLA